MKIMVFLEISRSKVDLNPREWPLVTCLLFFHAFQNNLIQNHRIQKMSRIHVTSVNNFHYKIQGATFRKVII